MTPTRTRSPGVALAPEAATAVAPASPTIPTATAAFRALEPKNCRRLTSCFRKSSTFTAGGSCKGPVLALPPSFYHYAGTVQGPKSSRRRELGDICRDGRRRRTGIRRKWNTRLISRAFCKGGEDQPVMRFPDRSWFNGLRLNAPELNGLELDGPGFGAAGAGVVLARFSWMSLRAARAASAAFECGCNSITCCRSRAICSTFAHACASSSSPFIASIAC